MICRRRSTFLVTAASAALLAGGCTLVTDLDSFEQVDGGTDADTPPMCALESVPQRDLALELREFTLHTDDQVVVRVVSTDDPPLLRSLAVIEPLGSKDALIEMPGAIPSGSHRLDVFADVDDDGRYTEPDATSGFIDHSWELEPCTPRTVFEHSRVFDALTEPIPVDEDATVTFANLPGDGRLFEVRVIDETNDQTVGLFRFPSLLETDPIVVLGGIIDPSISYKVAFYYDANDNGAYDPPSDDGDEAWELTGLVGGVNETFDYNAPPAMTDVGF